MREVAGGSGGRRLIRTHRRALLWGLGGIWLTVPFTMALCIAIVATIVLVGQVVLHLPVLELARNPMIAVPIPVFSFVAPVMVLAAILLPLTQRGLRWPLFGWLILGTLLMGGAWWGILILLATNPRRG